MCQQHLGERGGLGVQRHPPVHNQPKISLSYKQTKAKYRGTPLKYEARGAQSGSQPELHLKKVSEMSQQVETLALQSQ